MGPNQTPVYTLTGVYRADLGRVCYQIPNRSWDGFISHNGLREHPSYPEAQAYSRQEMAGMEQQLEADDLATAFQWRMSMVTPAQWEAELRRY
jgi:hypothetical protein